jgi:Ubiquitin-2 like Rad60 SUMO-like
MQIFLKDATKKNTTFDVKPDTSIEDLKAMIQNKLGIPPAQL